MSYDDVSWEKKIYSRRTNREQKIPRKPVDSYYPLTARSPRGSKPSSFCDHRVILQRQRRKNEKKKNRVGNNDSISRCCYARVFEYSGGRRYPPFECCAPVVRLARHYYVIIVLYIMLTVAFCFDVHILNSF